MAINLYRMPNGDIARKAGGTFNVMHAPTELEFVECCCEPSGPPHVTITGSIRAGNTYINGGVYGLEEVIAGVYQWSWEDPSESRTFKLIDLRETSTDSWTLSIWVSEWDEEEEEPKGEAISDWVRNDESYVGAYSFFSGNVEGDAADNITAARVD